MLSLKPQFLDEHDWYYEEEKGLEVIHDVLHSDGIVRQTDRITIPWKKILASVERYQKAKKGRKVGG